MSDDEGSASEGSASDGENPLSFYQGLMRCASTGGGVGEARASRDGKLRRLFVRQDGRVTRQNEAAPLPPAARDARTAFETAQAAGMPTSRFAESISTHRCGVKGVPNVVSSLWGRATGSGAGPLNSLPPPWPLLASAFLPSVPTARVVPEEHQRLYSGQFSARGDVFVSAGQGTNIALYDTSNWKVMKQVEARDIQWTITSTDTSPDGRFMTYSSITPVVHLCNVSGEYELHDSLDLRQGDPGGFAVWCAKFSAGGSELVCGCGNGQVMIYDIERKRVVGAAEAHVDDINSVAYADSAHQPHIIVSASDDTFVKVWDRREMRLGAEGSHRPAGVFPGHTEGLTHVTGKGDGVYVLTNAKDQTAKLWDLRKMLTGVTDCRRLGFGANPTWDYRFMDYYRWGRPQQHPRDVSVMTYRGHSVLRTLIRAHFSPYNDTSQQYIVTGSADGKVYIYDVLTGEVVRRLEGHTAVVRDVSWHPHKPLLASSSWDGTTILWTPASEQEETAGEDAE